VTSKAVLEKCRAEGLDIKNHMTTLSAGQEATVREWFTEGQNVSAIEVTEHVDLEAEKARARRSRRRRGARESEAETEVGVEVAEEAPAEAEGEPVPEGAAPVAPAVAVEAVAEPAVVESPAEAAPVAAAEAPPAEAAPPAEKPPAAAAAPPAEQPQVEKPPEPEEAKPPRRTIKPAGPQVVPKPAKLQGPRVVRVVAPDILGPRPPPRRRPLIPVGAGPTAVGAGRGKKPAGPEEEEGEGRKKGKRRSPRRRGGGRSADSGEKLHEWRQQDLAERSERLAAAAGGGLRRHRAAFGRRAGPTQPTIPTGRVEVDEPITIKGLSAATGLKASEIIRKLMGIGTIATVNQVLATETAETVMLEFGVELAVRKARTASQEALEQFAAREPGPTSPRAPVVTFLGHVDHGKTSLLDRIRHTAVAAGEAGGITQHMGAYRYDIAGRHVVFLDTPGHEAFTAMRARGANMTDVVVLVVAADDGVMPQTVEALNHALAAKVPIVVALNKIDLPGANPTRVLGQLSEQGLQPREWGGQVEVVRTSAVTGEGIDNLVEILSLEAELLELKAETDAPASGFVIEGEMDPGRGALARLLVLNGTLKVGDVLLAGRGYGTVRQVVDDKGRSVESTGPATPAEVAGLDAVPEAGDRFYVLSGLDRARQAAEERRRQARAEQLAVGPRLTVENLLSRIESGQANEVPLIIKADVQGSIEALVGSLMKLGTHEVKVNVLHAAVGGIGTGDVTLAEAAGAIIIGFNAVPDAAARQLADAKGVDIRLYRVIYDVIDDVRGILEEGLAPEVREETLGRAEVRQVFRISRVGTIAGCHVTDGVVSRNALVRITRSNIVIADDRSLDSLKRFKDDVREVRAGMECGLKVAGYDDVKEGDVLEFYRKVEVARKL